MHGIATAAGCQLVAACDLAVAADDTRFATPGVKIGLFCTTPMVPLVRAIPALFASDEQTAGAYARAWAHGLPPDYYATYQQRVTAVTRDDVAKAARDRLHPERMAIVVVGPQQSIERKIAELNLGRIELRDAEGEARKAAAAASSSVGK